MVVNRRLGILAFSAGVVLGCGGDHAGPGSVAGPSLQAAGSPPSLKLYGAGGLRRAGPRSPCAAPSYREFDFWLGQWNVFNSAGEQVGTNAVTAELDGCVVTESWTSSTGGRGRSINTYDVETGKWHQTWVTQFTLGHLRLSGGLVDGVMTMHGERPSPSGFTIFDDWTWTDLPDGRVLQVGVLDIPVLGIHSEFQGFYQRTDVFNPAPEVRGTQCHSGGPSARTRELDFLVGSWTVSTADGLVLGTSVVKTDLSDCLIEERFESSKGYQAVSFTYLDRVEQRFYRTYIDSEAERLELSGDFASGALVLSGTDGVPGGRAQVRVTFEPVSTGDVRQTVEISRDGGVTWESGLVLRYTRR
jgi:hypothetical protein